MDYSQSHYAKAKNSDTRLMIYKLQLHLYEILKNDKSTGMEIRWSLLSSV